MKESYALTEADTPVSPTSKKTYAEIVVNRPIIQRRKSDEGGKSSLVLETHLDTRLKTFHYHIPEALQTSLKPGHLVAVPFRHQVLQGVVVALHDHSPVQKTRPIQSILDPLPIVQASQLELAQWLAQQYLAPLTKCINYFLPPGANRQPQTVIEPITDIPLPSDLTPLERALHLYLQQQTKPSLLEDLEAKVVDGLIKKGLARRRTTLSKPKVGPKVERTVEMLISADEIDDALLTLGRQTKQAEILTHFLTLEDPLPTVSEICDAIGCTVSPVQALIDKEWLIHHPKQQLITIKPDVSQAELETIPSDFTNIVDQLEQHQAPRSLIELGLNTQSLQDLEALNIFVRFEEPERISLNLEPELLPLAISQVRGTARHAEVLHLLTQEDEPVWIGWIYAQTEATTKTLQDLNKAGLIAFDESRRWRDPLTGRSFTLNSPPQLTAEQADLWSEIKPNLDQHYKPYLLHGVTGSGKTEIYLRAIDYVLAQKKQAIFLVPEVMLATQIVDRVQARFPDQVALWHSSLSPGERFDTWERVRAGELPIIVGPRSALFSPVQNLGLIVIDEEHEHAYKQDQAPTFHLREAAIEYARLCDIPVIMGSATPDVVSYRKAQRGQYQLLTLPNRILAHQRHLAVQAALLKRSRNKANTAQANNHHFVSLPMPPVELIDLRDELRAGNRSIFSRALSDGIRQTLAAGEQVIIFLNRRGTATFVNCRDCGHVVDCPRCDTNLTYHAPGEKLICHYCGYQQNNPETCPVCNSS
ncbi:MAG: primosomal protein N', partial [Chloroflexota bacterium]